jgi:hypothetical protein
LAWLPALVLVLLTQACQPAPALSTSSPKARKPSTTTTSTSTTTTSTSTTTTSTSTTTTTTVVEGPTGRQPTSSTPPLAVDERPLTKVRMTVESSSEWATVDLRGGTIHVAGPPAVAAGAAQIYSTTGLAVQRGAAGAARVVVDLVYLLPDTASLELLVCKNTDGVTDVRIERVTGSEPVAVAHLEADRADGVWDGGCANPMRGSVATADLVPEGVWPKPVVADRSTFAIYSPWYDDAMFASQPFVDRPRQPYDTTDPESVAAMVEQAWNAGIDGFVYWYNGHGDNVERMDLVVRAAEAHGEFTFAPQLDISQIPGVCNLHDPSTVQQWVEHLLSYAASPAHLEVDGRPVLFLFGSDCLPAQTWIAVRDAVRRQGIDPFVLGDSSNPAYGYDGFWLLNPNTVADTDRLPSWYRWWADEARFTPARDLGSDPMLWAAGISPGEQDDYSGKPLWMQLQIPRAGGERYDRVWQAAAGSRPEWMVISSWNDFHEATYVQPSEELGTLALDQTSAWTSWFAGVG